MISSRRGGGFELAQRTPSFRALKHAGECVRRWPARTGPKSYCVQNTVSARGNVPETHLPSGYGSTSREPVPIGVCGGARYARTDMRRPRRPKGAHSVANVAARPCTK